jgi:hypothetical protein
MKEKIIEILKKYHLHHYGDFDKAVEELNDLFEEIKKDARSDMEQLIYEED